LHKTNGMEACPVQVPIPCPRPSHPKIPSVGRDPVASARLLSGSSPLPLVVKTLLTLPEGNPRMLLRPQVPDVSIRTASSQSSPQLGAASPTLGRKSLSDPEVSRSAPPPATVLGVVDEGSPGHSCSGMGSSPPHEAGLGRVAQRWWEDPHSLSLFHLDPCCCKVALILTLSTPPWIFGSVGASGTVHSYNLGQKPHSSGSSTLPACSK
jgi:hypothetical protein